MLINVRSTNVLALAKMAQFSCWLLLVTGIVTVSNANQNACKCDAYKDELLAKQYTRGKLLGCFQDQSNFRILNGYSGIFSETNSPENCMDVCNEGGFSYAGVEYGGECYCGNKEPTILSKIEDSKCNMKCPGDQSELCGGFWTVNIYETGLEPDDCDTARRGKSVGCYKDRQPFRLLDGKSGNFPQVNSPDHCIDVCKQAGYRFAGVEYGAECYCGNNKPPLSMKLPFTSCNMKCPVKTKSCGGFWTIHVYETGLRNEKECSCDPIKHESIGCYKDEAHPRLLSGYYGSFPQYNSPEKCIDLCFRSGFKYAGLEYGVECFCGDKEPPMSAKLAEHSCDGKCPHTQISCGGFYKMNVYKTGIKNKDAKNLSGKNAMVERTGWNC